MGIFCKRNFAKLGLYAAGISAGALSLAGNAFAVKIPNSAFSTSNLTIYGSNGAVIPDGGEMGCNSAFAMDFDFTIASETPLAAGDVLSTNAGSGSEVNRIPVGTYITAPIAIKNQNGDTVATWKIGEYGVEITIAEAGAGIQSLSGHINTGKNLITETCTTKDIRQEFKVDRTKGTGPQDTKTILVKKGTFPAQANHYSSATLSSARISPTIHTPNPAINSLYRSGGQGALSNEEIVKDLWVESASSRAFNDDYTTAIQARAVTPAGSHDDYANMSGGVSYNGVNIDIRECSDNLVYPCKKRMDANDGESKESFIQRLREAQGDQAIIPYGRIGDSVIVYFGDLPSSNADMLYSKTISNRYSGKSTFADVISPYHSTEIWNSVDQAVGDSNIYGGKIVFMTTSTRMVFEEPLTVNGEEVSVITSWHYRDGNNNEVVESKTLDRNASIGSTEVAVEKGTASLQLIDADSKSPIKGANFKLQKQNGSSWVDVENSTRTTDKDGKLQVISLEDGAYRWVQTGYAADYYEQGETPYYDNVNLQNTISSFELSNDGYGAVATNKRKSYTITFAGGEHAASNFSDIVKIQLYGENTIIPSTSDIKGATGWIFDGWDKVVAEKVTENATYTATWKKELTTIRGRVVWLDANNEDGIRPSSVGVSAVQDGRTLDRSDTADENGLFEIDQMNKYDTNGNLIDYSVYVLEDGYTTEVIKNDNGTFTVNLIHSPQTTIKINKIWDDENNKNAMRPESISFRLIMNGRHTDKTVTLGKNDTSATIENVSKYSDLSGNGTLVTYTIYEDGAEFYNVRIIKDSAYEFTVTNTLEDPAATNHNFVVMVSTEDGALDDIHGANIVLAPVSDNAPMPSDATDGRKVAPVGDTSNVNLGDVTFDEAGDYQYKISLETTPATIGDGNGNNEYTLTVKVERDPETNTLRVVSEEYTDANGNPIHPKDVSFDIVTLDPIPSTENVKIQLPVDDQIEEGAIDATVTGKDGAPMPSDAKDGTKQSLVNPDGSINLGDIEFTQPGEYKYDVKLDSDKYDIDTDEFTIVVKVELDETTNTLRISDIVAVDKDGNEISLEDLKLGIRKNNASNPDTAAVNGAPIFIIFGALAAGLGSVFFTTRRR